MSGSGKSDPVHQDKDEALKARLTALEADLDAAFDQKSGGKDANSSSDGRAIGEGLRAGSELAAGILVGTGIGYLLDQQFGLSPLFLIIFMMIGMMAGFLNIYRMAARKNGAP